MKRFMLIIMAVQLLAINGFAQTERTKTFGQAQPHGNSRSKRGHADKSNTQNSDEQIVDSMGSGRQKKTAEKPAKRKK